LSLKARLAKIEKGLSQTDDDWVVYCWWDYEGMSEEERGKELRRRYPGKKNFITIRAVINNEKIKLGDE